MTTPAIERMSWEEKLRTLEELWDCIHGGFVDPSAARLLTTRMRSLDTQGERDESQTIRGEWLKLRQQAGVKAPASDQTRKGDISKHGKLERDSGSRLDDDESE